MDSLKRFIAELRRRRVLRVALAYGAVAWLLIEVADTVTGPLTLPSWFPTFVIIVAALGFPVALLLAWAFDVTPGTAGDATRPASASPAGTPRLGGRTSWVVIGGAAVVAGIVLVPRAFREPGAADPSDATAASAEATITSIAVLPFMNMSSDAENEHFSDGLTEELLNTLAQIPGLRVAARTSSFAFKGKDEDVREIGGKLNVEAVLEGSVRKIGDRLRITAQLIQVSDGYHLWSQAYDRRLEDVFQIQDEISAAIVLNLAPHVAGHATSPGRHATENVAAYDLYLQGRHRFWQGSSEALLREAAALFERAIELDPEFSLAYAGLSDAYMLLGTQGEPAEMMEKSKAAAEKAIALDPRLAEGYVALASVNWLYEYDWAAADRHYQRSFSVNPLLHTRCICYAWYLAVVGNEETAVVEAERALELDPVARLPRVILAWMNYLTGRPEPAWEQVRTILETTPEDVSARRIAAWLEWDAGRRDDALEQMQRIRDDFDRRGGFEAKGPTIVLAELTAMYAAAGIEDEAARMAAALRERAARAYVQPEYVAAAEAALGRYDEAFEAMDRAVENRSNLGQFSILPVSRPLRADPRYREVLQRIGLASRVSELVTPRPAGPPAPTPSQPKIRPGR